MAESPPIAAATTNNMAKPAKLPDSGRLGGSIDFQNIDLPHFLQFYAQIADSQIDTSQLGSLPPILISVHTTNEVTRAEAVQLLEKALYDQAGIVATHTDNKRIALKHRSSSSARPEN